MIYGLDTTILVQLELADHEMHARAARLRDRLLGEGCSFALAPQVLAEEITRVFPGPDAVSTFHRWMRDGDLGRNRIIDTLLAATYPRAAPRPRRRSANVTTQEAVR